MDKVNVPQQYKLKTYTFTVRKVVPVLLCPKVI